MKTSIITSLFLTATFFTASAMADTVSFSKGLAKEVQSGLNECGNRARPSNVGEIKTEDGVLRTVPALTSFKEGNKASDLYNDCGGQEFNSVTEINLDDIPVVDAGGSEIITGYIFPDNYFELYVNGVLIAVDPVVFTPFNSSVVRFKADKPFTIAVRMVDWEESLGLGMESNRGTQFHPGDGGLVAHFKDANGKTVVITDNTWKAQTFYTSPIVDRSCLVIDGTKRDSSACMSQNITSFEATSAAHWNIPNDWTEPDFDDSSWPAATTFTNDIVGVDNKRSFTNFKDIFDDKDADADFIWSSNLVLDNLVMLRKTVK